MKRCVIFLAVLLALNPRLCAADAVPSATIFEGRVLCIRVAQLTDKFPSQFQSLQPTNKVAGMVLDLRLADGDAAAVSAAEKIISAQKSPLVILVNDRTRGGAAELAARLRAEKLGVVIGSANVTGEISPDIAVAVNAEDEKKFLENPFATATTNAPLTTAVKNELLPFVDHMTEAELVHRKIKDGEDAGEETLTPRAAPAQPVIRDPMLARAVDLLKALAILKPTRG